MRVNFQSAINFKTSYRLPISKEDYIYYRKNFDINNTNPMDMYDDREGWRKAVDAFGGAMWTPEEFDEEGRCYFHILVGSGHESSVHWVLESSDRRYDLRGRFKTPRERANMLVNLEDKWGRRALDYATTPEMQALLISYGATKGSGVNNQKSANQSNGNREDALLSSARMMVEQNSNIQANRNNIDYFNAFEEIDDDEVSAQVSSTNEQQSIEEGTNNQEPATESNGNREDTSVTFTILVDQNPNTKANENNIDSFNIFGEVDNDTRVRDNLFQSLLGLPVLAGVVTAANCRELVKATEGWSVEEITKKIDGVISEAINKKENINYEKLLKAFKK